MNKDAACRHSPPLSNTRSTPLKKTVSGISLSTPPSKQNASELSAKRWRKATARCQFAVVHEVRYKVVVSKSGCNARLFMQAERSSRTSRHLRALAHPVMAELMVTVSTNCLVKKFRVNEFKELGH